MASEARQKLEKIRPKTIAQASRISGVNPVDISVLTIYLKKEYGKMKIEEFIEKCKSLNLEVTEKN